MDRAWETQQQYEVHTGVVRVAIDVLNYEYNHDARRQSPRLSADRLQLSGDAGLDQETTKTTHPARIFRGYVSFDSTQQAASC